MRHIAGRRSHGACLMLAPPILSASPASAQDNAQYFTWFARLGEPESLFTVVYSAYAGTFVLDRNPRIDRGEWASESSLW